MQQAASWARQFYRFFLPCVYSIALHNTEGKPSNCDLLWTKRYSTSSESMCWERKKCVCQCGKMLTNDDILIIIQEGDLSFFLIWILFFPSWLPLGYLWAEIRAEWGTKSCHRPSRGSGKQFEPPVIPWLWFCSFTISPSVDLVK